MLDICTLKIYNTIRLELNSMPNIYKRGRNPMKKTLATVLAMLMLCTCLPLFAQAEETKMNYEQWREKLADRLDETKWDSLVAVTVTMDDENGYTETERLEGADLEEYKDLSEDCLDLADSINDTYNMYRNVVEEVEGSEEYEDVEIFINELCNVKVNSDGTVEYNYGFDLSVSMDEESIALEYYLIYTFDRLGNLAGVVYYAGDVYTAPGVTESGYVKEVLELEYDFKVASITVVSAPAKAEYNYLEAVSLDGLKVEATMSDGSIVDVTDLVTVTGFDTNKPVEAKTATVTYTDEDGAEFTATFDFTVKYTWWQWIIRILFLGFLWY